MIELVIIRYIHFLAIFCLIGSLCIEHALVTKKMSRKQIKKLSRVDAIYGISALAILLAGFSLWFWVGKPADYYSTNWIFHTKLTLFLSIGLISIYPTMFFIRERKGDPEEEVTVPTVIGKCIKIEILLAFIIPFLAVLMALGIGN